MANVKISELAAAAALTGAELVEVVQDGANVQTTTQGIADLGGGGGGHVIQDNGDSLTQRANLNIIGATVTDDAGNDATIVEITAGGDSIYTADGTITDAVRTVNIPVDGTLYFNANDVPALRIGDDGGPYIYTDATIHFGSDVNGNNQAHYGAVSLIADLTANDLSTDYASNTILSNASAEIIPIITLASDTIGKRLTIMPDPVSERTMALMAGTGVTVYFWDNAGNTLLTVFDTASAVVPIGGSATFVCLNATTWVAESAHGVYLD